MVLLTCCRVGVVPRCTRVRDGLRVQRRSSHAGPARRRTGARWAARHTAAVRRSGAPTGVPSRTPHKRRGPVPGSSWARGRPFWLDGELLPQRAYLLDGFDRNDLDAKRTEAEFERTRSVATDTRFAWGRYECTQPYYEHRMVTYAVVAEDHNRPTPPRQ